MRSGVSGALKADVLAAETLSFYHDIGKETVFNVEESGQFIPTPTAGHDRPQDDLMGLCM